MLPRISAALAQFISPISAASQQERLTPERDRHGLSRHQGKNRDPEKRQVPDDGKNASSQAETSGELAQVIPMPAKPASSTGPVESRNLPLGVTQALLQMMAVLREQRSSILRWLGSNAYRLAARQGRKNGKVRKGAIVDLRVE